MQRVLVSLLVCICVSCGSPHSSSPFSPHPVSPDAVRKTCAMQLSCLANPPITPGGKCVSEFEFGLATGVGIFFGPSVSDLQRYVDCASTASDCTMALSCASRNHGPDFCAAHPNGACDGDVRVTCQSGWGLYLTDCAALGMHCGSANGHASCTDGKSCDPATPAHCDGDHFVECNGGTGLESSIDCATFLNGGTCRTVTSGSSSSTGCMPSSSASCPNDTVTCDGAAGLVCAFGGPLRVECGQFDSHCVVTNNSLDCVPDASDCTSSSPDRCNAGALEMCVNGRYVATECTSIGLGTCQASSGGATCG